MSTRINEIFVQKIKKKVTKICKRIMNAFTSVYLCKKAWKCNGAECMKMNMQMHMYECM